MQDMRWRVLNVITNHEKRVAQQLNLRSVEQYVPVYSERSRWSDRVVTLERPLFPGYIFVRFDKQSRLAVISMPGVVQLLGETERDTVSNTEITRIRESLASGCLLRPYRGVVVGTAVRVLRGIFEGTEGIVTDLRQQCRMIMTLSATGQRFSLEMDLNDVEILCKPTSGAPPARKAQIALSRV